MRLRRIWDYIGRSDRYVIKLKLATMRDDGEGKPE